jgi:transposase
MSAHTTLKFSDDSRIALSTERYEHPDPRVQQRMEVLWLISQGETRKRAGILAGVSMATVGRYIALFREGGIAALRQFNWVGPKSDLEAHRPVLEVEFRERPPHTVAEACQRIQELTGVERRQTQVRKFLKKSLV